MIEKICFGSMLTAATVVVLSIIVAAYIVHIVFGLLATLSIGASLLILWKWYITEMWE